MNNSYLVFILPALIFISLNTFGSDSIQLNVRYSQNVDVRLSEEPETPNIVMDFIEIGKNNDGKVAFKFWLNQSNGHVCRLSGVSEIVDDRHLEYSEYMKYIKSTCVLKIYEAGDSIVIEDIGDECRKNYCGARGGIWKTSLPLSSKEVLRSPINLNSW